MCDIFLTDRVEDIQEEKTPHYALFGEGIGL